MYLPVAPRTLGDLVGESVKTFRTHARFIFSAFFLPSTLTCTAMAIGSSFATRLLGAISRMESFGPALYLPCAIVLACVLAWAAALGWSVIRGSEIVRMVLGKDQSLSAAAKSLGSRVAAVICASLLSNLPAVVLAVITFLLLTFCRTIIPAQESPLRYLSSGILYGLLGVISTVSIALSAIWGTLYFMVVIAEGLSLKDSFKRSLDLAGMRLLRGGSFICLLILAMLLIYFVIEGPLLIYFAFDEVLARKAGIADHQIALWFQMIWVVIDTISSIIANGVFYLGMAYYYNDLLLRAEGADMFDRLDKIKVLK